MSLYVLTNHGGIARTRAMMRSLRLVAFKVR
jgi:hypothetical protein